MSQDKPKTPDWGAMSTQVSKGEPAPASSPESFAPQGLSSSSNSDDRYVTQRELGRGGMGRVMVALEALIKMYSMKAKVA